MYAHPNQVYQVNVKTEFRLFACLPLGKLTKFNHQILDIPLNSIVNPIDLHNIKGPQEYHKFYHTSSEGLVDWMGKETQFPFHTHWVLMLRPLT